ISYGDAWIVGNSTHATFLMFNRYPLAQIYSTPFDVASLNQTIFRRVPKTHRLGDLPRWWFLRQMDRLFGHCGEAFPVRRKGDGINPATERPHRGHDTVRGNLVNAREGTVFDCGQVFAGRREHEGINLALATDNPGRLGAVWFCRGAQCGDVPKRNGVV